MAAVSMMAKGRIVNRVLSASEHKVFLIFTTQLYSCYAVGMQLFSYFDKREVLQQEYSQRPILPSPHFRWVVNNKWTLFLCFPMNVRSS